MEEYQAKLVSIVDKNAARLEELGWKDYSTQSDDSKDKRVGFI
mgnify:FL=1